MNRRTLASILVALGGSTATSAQYVEPDVEVLFEVDGTGNVRFGAQVVALGDVDGDGVIDLATSSFDIGTINPIGRALALSGVNGHGLWLTSIGQPRALESLDWNADGVLDVATGDPQVVRVYSGINGALLTSLPPVPRPFGTRLAAGGDLDGNGLEDLLVGAPTRADFDFDGNVFVYARGSTLPFSSLQGEDGEDEFGTALAFLGDTNVPPDGRDEIAVATLSRVRVFGWQATGPVERFRVDLVGRSVRDIAGGKDVSGDGVPDFAVGLDDGVRVFSGADGALLHTFGLPNPCAALALVEDVDGDSRPDIAAGSPFNSSGASRGGQVLIWSGASGTLRKTITSTTPEHRLGADVRELDDFDGDGKRDLLVGAAGSPAPVVGLDQGSVLVFALGGQVCLTLDFETEDDFVTPLSNGQHIDSEFGSLATLSSSGANAGLAIFDSTPGGPNDPSQDRDLLVGSGNILILQTENFPPDANDVFPRPNDDEDGGTLAFAFTTPVEPVSVKLIDSDAGDAPLFVVLTDGAARQRVYTVPSNWTGDVLLGQPGQGTLDLATLAPQAGFGSIATASEDPQFDPQGVSTIAFLLDGSGGIDELAVCTASLPRASVRVRNGSGTNPMNLAAISRPVLGGTWTAALDCTGLGAGLATLAVRRWAASGTWSGMGEVLIGGSLLYRTFAAHPGTVRQLGWPIPFDLSLCGLEVHAQGLCKNTASGAGPRPLARATLSNALDLTLGF
mgnify:CR=1 FL=1